MLIGGRQEKRRIDVDEMRRFFAYNPSTGDICFRERRGNRPAGTTAGSVKSGSKYRQIRVNGETYLAHRVAWAIHYGTDPGELDVDHIDRDGLNNAIQNLRLMTRSRNKLNSGGWSQRDGLKGAYQRGKRWLAKCRVDGVTYRIGLFDTAEEAHAAYTAKVQELTT